MKIPARKIMIEWTDGSRTTHEAVDGGIDVTRIFSGLKETGLNLKNILSPDGLFGTVSGMKVGDIVKIGLKFLGM